VRPASAPLGRATGFTAATSVGRIRPQTATLVRIAGAEPNAVASRGSLRRPASAQSSSLSLARRLGKIGSAPNLHGKGLYVAGLLVNACESSTSLSWKAGGLEKHARVDLASFAREIPSHLRNFELDLSEVQTLGDHDLSAVCAKLPPSLETLHLRLWGCMGISDTSMLALASALSGSQLRKLCLEVSGTDVGEEGLRLLLQALPTTMSELQLRIAHGSQMNAVAGMTHFPPYLQSLELGLHSAVDEHAAALGFALPRGLRLLELDMHNCDRLTDTGVAALTESMGISLNTLSLHLRMSSTSSVSEMVLAPLARRVGQLQLLQSFSLSLMGCGLVSDAGLLRLGSALPASLGDLHLRCWFCRQLTDGLVDSLLCDYIGSLSLSELELDFHQNAGKGRTVRWKDHLDSPESLTDEIDTMCDNLKLATTRQGALVATQQPQRADPENSEERRREEAIKHRLRQLQASRPWQDSWKQDNFKPQPLALLPKQVEQRLEEPQQPTRPLTAGPAPCPAPQMELKSNTATHIGAEVLPSAARPPARPVVTHKMVDSAAIENQLKQLGSLWDRDAFLMRKAGRSRRQEQVTGAAGLSQQDERQALLVLPQRTQQFEGERGELQRQLRERLQLRNHEVGTPASTLLASPNEPEAETQPESRHAQEKLGDIDPARRLFGSREASPRPRRSKFSPGDGTATPPKDMLKTPEHSTAGKSSSTAFRQVPLHEPMAIRQGPVHEPPEPSDGPDSAAGRARLPAKQHVTSSNSMDAPKEKRRLFPAMDAETVVELGESPQQPVMAALGGWSQQWQSDTALGESCMIAQVNGKTPGSFNMAVGFIMTCPLSEEDGAESAHGSSVCGAA